MATSSTSLNLGAAPSPNWHWKNKNITSWAKSWFESELVNVISTDSGITIGVESVEEVDGDVELGMRKSKLITIYDCKLKLSWTATAADEVTAKGTVTIPEVSHEITCDKLSDYAFDFNLGTSRTPEVNALYEHVRKSLPKLLIAKFDEFPNVIVETHGRDLTVTQSGTATPVNTESKDATSSAPVNSITKAALLAAASKATVINTGLPVNVEGSFMASADDLFAWLTDERKIPVWSRAVAKSNPVVGEEYFLFGGNITGKYVTVERPKKIVQTWKSKNPTWPQNHEATLTTTFEQSSDSTKILFKLTGVPKGLEDETARNLEGYYIRGLKGIGYVKQPKPSLPSQSSNTQRALLVALSASAVALISIYYFS